MVLKETSMSVTLLNSDWTCWQLWHLYYITRIWNFLSFPYFLRNNRASYPRQRSRWMGSVRRWQGVPAPAYVADKRAKATSAFALAYYGVSLYLLVSFYITIENLGTILAPNLQKPLWFYLSWYAKKLVFASIFAVSCFLMLKNQILFLFRTKKQQAFKVLCCLWLFGSFIRSWNVCKFNSKMRIAFFGHSWQTYYVDKIPIWWTVIGDNAMYRPNDARFGFVRWWYWCGSQLWRGRIKIVSVGA